MILVSDFDKTLYPHGNDDLFRENLRAVQQFREDPEHKFILATGRSLSSILRVFPDYREYMDYIILDNGAVCYDARKGETAAEYTLAKKTAEKIVALIREAGAKGTFVYYSDLVEHENLENDCTKIRFWTDSDQKARKIVDQINLEFATAARAYLAQGVVPSSLAWIDDLEYSSFVDIAPIMAGKENMIRKLKEEFYPEETRIVTVGDSWNDVDMLKDFEGYAMAEADEDVRAAVAKDHTVASVADLIRRVG